MGSAAGPMRSSGRRGHVGTRHARYTLVDGDAVEVTPGGSKVRGTVVNGKFRPHSRHYGTHRMWYPARPLGSNSMS